MQWALLRAWEAASELSIQASEQDFELRYQEYMKEQQVMEQQVMEQQVMEQQASEQQASEQQASKAAR
jgi:hypothetical protein